MSNRLVPLALALATVAAGGGVTYMVVDDGVPAPVYEVHPEDFCNGACPGPDGDWTDVFASMFEACTPTTFESAPDRYRLRRGCRVRLACDFDYVFWQDLLLTRAHTIEGCGLGGGWGNTTLLFQQGGVRAEGPYAQVALHGLHVKGASSTVSIGIDAFAGIRLRDVFVQGFGMGIHIRGDSTQGSNANNWYMDNVLVQSTGGPGVYIEGYDANAGLALGLNVSNTCQLVPAGSDCWSIRDRSFLGNTYVSPHTAYSGNLQSTFFPQFMIENATSSTLLLNPYQEGQAAGSELRGTGLVISGRIQNTGDPGFTQIRGRGVVGDLGFAANGADWAALGTTVGAIELRHTSPSVDLRYVYDPATSVFGWKPSGAGHGEAAVTNPTSKTGHGLPVRSGWSWTGRNGGWYEGFPTAVVAHTITADTNPPPDCGGHPVGSEMRHVRPLRGGPLTWICVCDTGQPIPNGGCTAGTKSWRTTAMVP